MATTLRRVSDRFRPPSLDLTTAVGAAPQEAADGGNVYHGHTTSAARFFATVAKQSWDAVLPVVSPVRAKSCSASDK